MKSSLQFLSVALVLLLLGTTARADYEYRFVTGAPSYTATVGETFVVDVFLQETVTGADASRLVGADNGLLTAGFLADFGANAEARVLSEADLLPNPLFTSADFLVRDLPGDGTAGLLEAADFGDAPVVATEASAGVFRVALGGFRFTALQAGSFDLLVGDFSPDLAETVTAQGFAIDDPTANLIPARGVTITIREAGPVVPEPSGLVLIGLGSTCLGVLAARRRTSFPRD